MTRKSEARLKRGHREMPKRDNIAAVILDRASETILFTTNDMLVNQLQRDGHALRVPSTDSRMTTLRRAAVFSVECAACF